MTTKVRSPVAAFAFPETGLSNLVEDLEYPRLAICCCGRDHRWINLHMEVKSAPIVFIYANTNTNLLEPPAQDPIPPVS